MPRGAGAELSAMGVVHSDVHSDVSSPREVDEDFVLIPNTPDKHLCFDPSQSYAVGYGINHQTHEDFKQRELDYTVVKDAVRVFSALQEKGAVLREHTIILEAKVEPQSCTFKGMKASLQEQAWKVGENGILFFHFSGHGIRGRSNKFCLAPVDFDRTPETCITARVLTQWLQEAKCKAKYILLTLDCCYAGGIAGALTRGTDVLETISGLYVMASCTANESSTVVGTLGHSTFCYFLGHAIHSTEFSAGQLPVKTIYEKCRKLSVALSSLLVGYDEKSGVRWKTMEPQLSHGKVQPEGADQPDGGIMRFSYATELYKRGKKKDMVALDDSCIAWIKMSYAKDNAALQGLKEEGVLDLEQCIRDTVLCSMMYSVAAIQLACQSGTAASTNLIITAYMEVVAAIDMVKPGVVLKEREFELGVGYYQHGLQSVQDNKIRALLGQLRENVKAKAVSAGQMMAHSEQDLDMPDSGEVECTEHLQLPSIRKWIPL